jgi:MYXO-CTERM domain-containing protein
VVARSGSAYQSFFGKAPDAELPPGASSAVPDMTAFLPWTGGAAGTMQLTNAGDELLVLDPSNTILDIAVFGNGAYAGINPFTPAPGVDEVLSRNATSSDTDDCKVDFSNVGVACTNDAQCGGTCMACLANVCGPKPQGAPCPDANPCNGDEVCDGNGACVTGPTPPCDDQNPCTTDACTPAMGCTHTPVAAGTSCSDGDVCNGAEVCDATGTCKGGTPLDCADTDPCTVDTCDKVMGCQHAQAADGSSCSDGDACNGAETCMGGTCMPGTAPDCDDQNPCTTDACDKVMGCTHANVSDGVSCDDGDVCNGAETCVGGTCTSENPLDCNDANDCTVDTCDKVMGCQHQKAADGTTCAGSGCNGTCSAGACACGAGGAGGATSSSSSSSGSASSSSGSASSSSGGEGGQGGSTSSSSGGVKEGGACGCRTAGGDDADPALWVVAIGAALAFTRRRSARR